MNIFLLTFAISEKVFRPRIELGTFCVLDRCDNHYTTMTIGNMATPMAGSGNGDGLTCTVRGRGKG